MSCKAYPEPLSTTQTFHYFYVFYPDVADRPHFPSEQTEPEGGASTSSDYQEVRPYVFLHFQMNIEKHIPLTNRVRGPYGP